jgi:hypothetical protein
VAVGAADLQATRVAHNTTVPQSGMARFHLAHIPGISRSARFTDGVSRQTLVGAFCPQHRWRRLTPAAATRARNLQDSSLIIAGKVASYRAFVQCLHLAAGQDGSAETQLAKPLGSANSSPRSAPKATAKRTPSNCPSSSSASRRARKLSFLCQEGLASLPSAARAATLISSWREIHGQKTVDSAAPFR